MPIKGKLLRVPGSLYISGDMTEGIPSVKNGLIAHFPLEGQYESSNFVGLGVDWKNPSNWSKIGGSSSATMIWDEQYQALKITYSSWWRLNFYIPVDTNAHWYVSAEVMSNTISTSTGRFYLGDIAYSSPGDTTGITQHPGTYEYFGSAGSIMEEVYKWKYFRNYAISGTPRTGTSEIVSELDKWDPQTNYCNLLFIANYPSGDANHSTWIRNISMQASFLPYETGEPGKFWRGISFEDTITNQVNSPSDVMNHAIGATPATAFGFSGNNWDARFGVGNWHCEIVPADDSPVVGLDRAYRINTYTSGNGGFTAGNWGATSGSLCYSMWIKLYYGTIQWGDLNSSNRITITTGNAEVGKWTYVGSYGISGSPGGRHLYTLNTTKADILCIQQTATNSPRQYADSTNPRSASSIWLTGFKDIPDYTIFGEFAPNTPFDDDPSYTYTPNSSTHIRVEDSTGGGFYYRYFVSGGLSAPYLDPDGSYGTTHLHSYYSLTANAHDKIFYVIRKTATTLKMDVYQNGWKSQHSGTISASNQGLEKIGLATGAPKWGGRHSNISVYNRYLSDDEAFRLVEKGRNDMSKYGDIHTPIFIERPYTKNLIAYWNPLTDGDEITGTTIESPGRCRDIEPQYQANIGVENSAAWVGTIYGNLVYGNLVATDNNKFVPGWYVIGTGTNTRKTITSGTISVASSSVYTFSFLYWSNDGDLDDVYLQFNDDGWPESNNYWNMNNASQTPHFEHDNPGTYPDGDTLRIGKTYYGGNTWRIWGTFRTHATTSTINNIFFDSDVSGRHVFLGQPSVVQTQYVQPYFENARGAGFLEFNLYRDIGLLWSGDWTIIYWKKPTGTNAGTNNLTGYNLSSLGGTGIGAAGYLWWGKNTGANTIQGSTPFAFDPNGYFGHWIMISMQKTGTNIRIVEWDIDGVKQRVRNASTTNSDPDYYVSSVWNYDLCLHGEYHANMRCNSYYRDLLVFKSYLTDAQTEDIHDRGLKILKNRIAFNGRLKEAI